MTSYTRIQPFAAHSPGSRTCRILVDAGRGRTVCDPCLPVTTGWCSDNLGLSDRTRWALLNRTSLNRRAFRAHFLFWIILHSRSLKLLYGRMMVMVSGRTHAAGSCLT